MEQGQTGNEGNSFIGLRAHERPPKIEPGDVRLDDGGPLYFALIDNPGVTISASDSNGARDRLSQLFAIDPDAVLSCQGRTAQDALRILAAIELHVREDDSRAA